MQRTCSAPARDGSLLRVSSLRECPHCGLFQTVPPLPPHAAARCPRCDVVLRRRRADPLIRPLAMAIAGLMLMLVAARLPFLDVSVFGMERATTLLSGPRALRQDGMDLVAAVILVTTLAAPVLRLLAVGWVLAGLRLRRPPRHLGLVFRWAVWLRPWSMIEVFLLGVFVAYTKLVDMVRVEVGTACYALGALMLVMAALDAMLDPQSVWEALPPRGEARGPRHEVAQSGLVGCDTCGQVGTFGETACTRCGAALHARKPESISRTWALLLAAACLYAPANILPVLTLTRLGQGAPSTILGGALELLHAGMWPLALLVFVASITVPVLKILSLGFMLVATRAGSGWRLRERTKLYRLVDFIGRWSMIDVFMISILAALVQLGFFATVYPGPGAAAFCGVVILTMFAASSFDPRLMWDAAAGRREPPA